MLSPNTIDTDYSLYLSYTATYTFNFGLQAGFSLLLLITLLALTRPSKRRTPIFLLNILALTTCTLRVFLQTCYFWSPSWSWTVQFKELFVSDIDLEGWSPNDPGTWRGQQAAAVFAAMQSTCIMLSLYLQIKAVCEPMAVKWQQTSMMALTGSIAIANIVLAWLHTSLQIQILGVLLSTSGAVRSSGTKYVGLWQLISWINQGSVAYFSLVFCTKLAAAVLQRRRLGIRQFGAMEIVMIMALQTMLVPAIFVIVQPYTTMPLFSALSLTLVTIFLPFSAVWAAECMPDEESPSTSSFHHRNDTRNSHTSSSRSTAASFRTKLFGARTPTTMTTTTTRRMDSSSSSSSSASPSAASTTLPRSARLWRWSWKKGEKGKEDRDSVDVGVVVEEKEENEKEDV